MVTGSKGTIDGEKTMNTGREGKAGFSLHCEGWGLFFLWSQKALEKTVTGWGVGGLKATPVGGYANYCPVLGKHVVVGRGMRGEGESTHLAIKGVVGNGGNRSKSRPKRRISEKRASKTREKTLNVKKEVFNNTGVKHRIIL